MRMKKTLWKLVLIDFNKHFATGLCAVISRMYESKRITLVEMNFILNDIKIHGDTSERYDPIFYIWKPRSKKPRIEFIENQIKKYSQQKK